MLKLTPSPTFWAKCDISIPGADKPARIEVEFRHLGKEAIKAYFDGLDGKTDNEALAEIITGWKGVDAEYGNDTLAALLDAYPAAALELFSAYKREAIEARIKN